MSLSKYSLARGAPNKKVLHALMTKMTISPLLKTCAMRHINTLFFPEKNEYRKSLNKKVGHLSDKEQSHRPLMKTRRNENVGKAVKERSETAPWQALRTGRRARCLPCVWS